MGCLGEKRWKEEKEPAKADAGRVNPKSNDGRNTSFAIKKTREKLRQPRVIFYDKGEASSQVCEHKRTTRYKRG